MLHLLWASPELAFCCSALAPGILAKVVCKVAVVTSLPDSAVLTGTFGGCAGFVVVVDLVVVVVGFVVVVVGFVVVVDSVVVVVTGGFVVVAAVDCVGLVVVMVVVCVVVVATVVVSGAVVVGAAVEGLSRMVD